METAADQKQPRWISSLRIITVVGYVVLFLAIKLMGQMAGYSNDTTAHLIDSILARSLMLLPVFVFAGGLIGTSLVARRSRLDMDKGHLGVFALAALLGGVGMAVMARHGSPAIQDGCFDGLAFLIAWSMGLEYQFVASLKLADHQPLIANAEPSVRKRDLPVPRHTA